MDPKTVVVEFAKNLLFESSSEDEEVLEKVDNYAELTVPFMSDKQFKQNFRLNVYTFEDLLTRCNQMHQNNNDHIGFPKTTTEKELMITIWYLGNMESLRSVAERFGISKSTCWDVLYRTCNLLLDVNRVYKVISWPNIEKQQDIRNSFSRNGFPGIIGCIDGSHIRINAPQEYPNSYVNRKSFHSILLQGVCDNKKLFTDVYAGEAGSIHDYTLFKRSDLYRRITNEQVAFYDDGHLVGDLAYRVSTFLLTSYKNHGRLTQRERNYNIILSKARVTIENSLAYLKGRFRRLKFLETKRLELASLLIVSCCVLHNICILNGDFAEEIMNLVEEVEEERNNNPHNLPDFDANANNRIALVKRNNICNALPMLQNYRHREQ